MTGSIAGASIRDAVAEADLRVLLMSVFHLSGDHRWLGEPFRPGRDVRLVADPSAGLPAEVGDEIRAAAVDLAARTPAIDDPGDALMTEMMSVCLGEAVPPEYAPMMREELGLTSRDVTPPPAGWRDDVDVLVVGAGVSGTAMAVRLDRLGVPYAIVDSGRSVGGVWRENRYPGCGVDTPNHAYSFSFAPPHRWSRYFAGQAEVEAYIQETADAHGVTDRVSFETSVRAARWCEDERRWHVELVGPGGLEHRRVSFLISAIGQLNEPSTPPLTGLESFAGPSFHSACWPDGLDVEGRHVAVIGTGASAMQLVPAIADRVANLTIYQRSPQWARPVAGYRDPIPAGSTWLFEHLPFYAAWFRLTMTWRYGDGLLPLLQKDPDWPHPDRSVNRINDRHRAEMTDHILRELEGRPDLVERCVPDYPPYGKRILLDAGWFRALRRPGVELVTEAIERVTETGVRTECGTERRADVIVAATGFSVTEMAARLDITGRHGVNLRDAWAGDDPRAYLGISVPGFPNLFCMQGPNTGLGHGGSAIFQSECQARHITSCLTELAEAGADTIEVRRGAHDDYVARVDARHEGLIWTHPGMSTYYRNPKGRVVSVMPWRLVDYWAMTHDAVLDDYDLR